MANDLTVSGIAQDIAPLISNSRNPSQEDVEFAIRRIRNWTLAGALVPIGDPHTGTGKHRRYDGSSVFIAGVLNDLADRNQTIGTLLVVAQFIRALLAEDPSAESGTEGAPGYFASALRQGEIFLIVATDSSVSTDRRVRVEVSSSPCGRIASPHWRSAILVNLTMIFREVGHYLD